MLPTRSVLALLACGAVLWAAWQPNLAPPRFQLGEPVRPAAAPHWEAHLIAGPSEAPSVHSATLAALPGGDRLAFWYGGTDEAKPDVAVYMARYHDGRWQPGHCLLRPAEVARAESRFVRRVGNPVVHRDAQDRLHLFFVSVGFGGWAGSSLNQMISRDEGSTWSAPRRLVTSPFLNLSTLVRNRAVSLADGGFLLPVYHEMIRKFPELLWFDADGKMLRKIRMDGQHGSLQPCVVPVAAGTAFGFLRDRCLGGNHVLWQRTEDGGITWTPPRALDLPNVDSAVTAGRLADGRLLLAYNPTYDRDELDLAVSADGLAWRQLAQLEHGSRDDEFSYPTLLVDGDNIDLCYTWKRKHIKHVRLNHAWIAAQEQRPGPLSAKSPDDPGYVDEPPASSVVEGHAPRGSFGQLGHALLLAWLVVSVTRWCGGRRIGQGFAVGLVVLAWLLPWNARHPLYYVHGLLGDLSITTQALLVLGLLRGFGLPVGRPRSLEGGPAVAMVLAGLALYAATLGYLRPDIYAWGYRPHGLLIAIAVWLWWARGTDLAIAVVVALLGFAWHLLPSPNLWDALLDPLVVVGLAACVTRGAIATLRQQRRVSLRSGGDIFPVVGHTRPITLTSHHR
jgi:predicted neuraminidase